jgi:hypothetical protein
VVSKDGRFFFPETDETSGITVELRVPLGLDKQSRNKVELAGTSLSGRYAPPSPITNNAGQSKSQGGASREDSFRKKCSLPAGVAAGAAAAAVCCRRRAGGA